MDQLLASLPQVLTLGILVGGFYGLIAVGLNLIFGVMNVINIAHGDFIVLAAYGVYWLYAAFGLNILFSVLVVVPIIFVVGFPIQKGLIEHPMRTSSDAPLLITFGLSVILENIMDILWSGNSRREPILTANFYVGPVVISQIWVYTFLLAVVTCSALYLFLRTTMTGKAVRAVSMDSTAASLVGINAGRIRQVGFALGLALAAIAGTAFGFLYAFEPTTGADIVLIAFVVVVLGGTGNPLGTFFAGILLGIVGNVTSLFAPALVDAVMFAVFLAVLFVRPGGLFKQMGAN